MFTLLPIKTFDTVFTYQDIGYSISYQDIGYSISYQGIRYSISYQDICFGGLE